MRTAYCTVLTSEDFAIGVKVLHKSLSTYSSKEFVVFVNSDIGDTTVKNLQNRGMTVIRAEEPDIPEECISSRQAADRWNKTLFKLVCFKPCGYDKLVYIDSDILVRADIDVLFEQNGLAAVNDSDFFPCYGREGINSGVMIIEPTEAMYEEIVARVPMTAENLNVFGDQDVINNYLSTCGTEYSMLSRLYNTCFYSCEDVENPKAVHFILASKPWEWNFAVRIMKMAKWFIKGRKKQIKYLREYTGVLRLVKD